MNKDRIVIRGAREHNLKNISLELPRNKLVVITGLSGSGKSSLAFDTLYAEGQRRYVESLSAYARQFLQQMPKPDVDAIEGLSPAISIEQKVGSRNPRSTVATVTEIYDHFRLLFARVGTPFCYSCGRPIEGQTVQQMVDAIMQMAPGTRFMIFSPVVRGRKGEYKKEFERFRREGFIRARVDGEMVDLSLELPELERKRKHTIELLIDRLVLKNGIVKRLTDGMELALKLSGGTVLIETTEGERTTFSEEFGCVDCNISYPEVSPRLFSFNSPYGACRACQGLGVSMYFDPSHVVPDETKSIASGAVAPWAVRFGFVRDYRLRRVCNAFDVSMDTAFMDLPEQVRTAILFGTRAAGRPPTGRRYHRHFEGIIPILERRFHETKSETVREELQKYMSRAECRACKGRRLRPEALSIRIGGANIIDLTRMSVSGCLSFLAGLKLSGRKAMIADRLLKEIGSRLSFLDNVGLEYLSLDRASGTLSGGETQRIRLASQIGSMLVGVLYILDEPSIGLHQRDNRRLLETLKHLRDLGNTLLVVEHDEDTILAADHVVDMGPGAGIHGGEVVAQGTAGDVMAEEKSLTGRYLSGRRFIPVPSGRRKGRGGILVLRGCRANNLRGIDAAFPLGTLICVTGVSGSGKSSLVVDTLLPSLEAGFFGKKRFVHCDHIEGLDELDKVIAIDQSPIGRTPRSNPATYTGFFAPIRVLFSRLPEARARGYRPGRFSFNVKGGRCEACEGAGVNRIEMHFLPDIYVECEQCRGRRYNRETLEIRYRHASISDVLDMTVNQAFEFFINHPSIRSRLEVLRDVGLGYIKVGQAATTLSGGEAQRIKLARELSKRSAGRTLYILDEPTTGLHCDDINKLLEVLNRLVESGNTVVVIEHNLDVIKTADHVIDLGPEGGDLGGTIVASGTPEEVAKSSKSYTGRFLKEKLKR